MNSRSLWTAAIFALVLGLHLFLYSQLPSGRTDHGWPTNTMRNWHEYGYWPLHGQLVANSGGLDPGEVQFIYPGHRPYFLIVPYLLKELPGAAFGDGLLYDFTVITLVFAAVVWLLGVNYRGLLIASVVCLTPGIMNNISAVDTIAIPSMLGIAALAFAAGALVRNQTRCSTRVAALLVLVLYMLLNWSTLFPLGIAVVYVLCRHPDWKKAVPYFGAALLVGIVMLYVSMHSRHASVANSGDFWNGYLWGPLGYDLSGMNLTKAFVRIMAVNTIAWLPLVLAALLVLLLNGRGERWRQAALPLLASIAAVFVLRNYNAHHPWNIVCQIGLGLIFSIELLTGPKMIATGKWRFVATGAMALFAIGYLISWMALDEFNGRDHQAVEALVAKNTPRDALIVIADGLLPVGVKDLAPFSEGFDRKLISLDEWQSGSFTVTTNREIFLLSHTTSVPDTTLIAQSHLQPTWADKVMVPLFDFYRNKISRRAPGNRKQYFEEYKLYKF